MPEEKASAIPPYCQDLLPPATIRQFTGDALTMIALKAAMDEIYNLKRRVAELESKGRHYPKV